MWPSVCPAQRASAVLAAASSQSMGPWRWHTEIATPAGEGGALSVLHILMRHMQPQHAHETMPKCMCETQRSLHKGFQIAMRHQLDVIFLLVRSGAITSCSRVHQERAAQPHARHLHCIAMPLLLIITLTAISCTLSMSSAPQAVLYSTHYVMVGTLTGQVTTAPPLTTSCPALPAASAQKAASSQPLATCTTCCKLYLYCLCHPSPGMCGRAFSGMGSP